MRELKVTSCRIEGHQLSTTGDETVILWKSESSNAILLSMEINKQNQTLEGPPVDKLS